MTSCRAWLPPVLASLSLLVLGCSSGGAALDAAAAGSTGTAGAAGTAGAQAGAEGSSAGAAGSVAGAAGNDAGAAGHGLSDAGAGGADAGGGHAGASGTGVDGGAAGATVATSCGKDLSGTWDLISQKPGSPDEKAVMVIGPDLFSFTKVDPNSRPGQLTYTTTPSKQVTYQHHQAHTVAVDNKPTALDAGSFPLALGGMWTFSSEGGVCTASVAAGLLGGRCTNSQFPYFGVGDWPSGIVPQLLYNVDYVATRTAASASNFGELGGVWTASGKGVAKSCTIKVEGNKISGLCTSGISAGRTELTIGDDCVASGVNDAGYQLSGRRR